MSAERARAFGMMCGIELGKEGTRAPRSASARASPRRHCPRGLIFLLRGGAADPAIGDTICIAPAATPTETLDRHRRHPAGVDHGATK